MTSYIFGITNYPQGFGTKLVIFLELNIRVRYVIYSKLYCLLDEEFGCNVFLSLQFSVEILKNDANHLN